MIIFSGKYDDININTWMYFNLIQGCESMKIGEAQQLYREQVQAYQAQKAALSKQLQKIRSKMELSDSEQEQYGSEAAVLELSIDALNEKQTQYQEYLSELTEQYCAYWNAAVAEQQSDATEEYAAEMGKLLEVARRIMKGAIVPASDEKKLMEFDYELYIAAKNIGAMARREKKEEYDSLWKDEEKKEYDDPKEAAENAEAASAGPEIVDVSETLASVAQEE